MRKILNSYTIIMMGFIALNQACSNPTETVKADRFQVTDSLISRLLVDTVEQANNRTDLNFSAKIIADEDQKAEVFPMVSGIVGDVRAKLGDQVTKGQILATMLSAEMVEFDKEMISTAAELRNAERNLKQTEELFKSGLSSARELEEAKNEFLIKEAEDKRAKAVFNLNGGIKNGDYILKSPLTGFVIEKNVTSNMQIRPDNDRNLFTIADLSTVWAMINIYESDISRIKEGDEVSIAVLSYPEKVFEGKIDHIYSIIDNESKVLNARVKIANPTFSLKPGMIATVTIAARSGVNLPVVNSRGIIFDDNKNYVVVLDTQNKVHIQEIEIGRKTAEKSYISKGLNPGDRIIASKQVFVYESLKTNRN